MWTGLKEREAWAPAGMGKEALAPSLGNVKRGFVGQPV